MSELEELRSFVEVVRTGGFSQAARRLGISKSMVSRRVANLEASLGTRLLSRTTRPMPAMISVPAPSRSSPTMKRRATLPPARAGR